MATRAYVRGSGGKFAGAGTAGTKVTYGKAGGFANASFRQRVLASRSNARPAKPTGKKSPPTRKRTASQKDRRQMAVGLGVAAVSIGLASRRGASPATMIGGMVGASLGGRIIGDAAGNMAARGMQQSAATRRRAKAANARPKIQAGAKAPRATSLR